MVELNRESNRALKPGIDNPCSVPTGKVSKPAEMGLEPAGKPSKRAGRPSETAGRLSGEGARFVDSRF